MYNFICSLIDLGGCEESAAGNENASVFEKRSRVSRSSVMRLPLAALTIKDGQTGTATLSVFPLGGFAQAVQFTCWTVPANVTCSFSQAQVTPDGVYPSNVTLTVNTSGTLAPNTGRSNLWAVTSTFALAGILLPFGKRKRWRSPLLRSA
jgi:hypothetical protein